MRTPLVLSAAIIAASASLASAGPAEDGERVRQEVNRLFIVFANKDAREVLEMLADTVRIGGLTFTDKKCKKAFARDTVVKGKARAKLAACLVKVPGLPTADTEFEVTEYREVWQADFQDGSGLLFVRFGLDVHPPRIEEMLGSDVELAGVAGEWRGKVGGVVSTIDDRHAGQAAPVPTKLEPGPDAPPPPRPKNVAPTAVEAQRLTGDKRVQPDDKTRREIAKSAKARAIASYKMCLAETGAVASVTQLKASGFPRWDSQIQTAMKTWTYRPFLDDATGAAIQVCTAVTFIYIHEGE